jgi:hypothetical protein
MFKALSDAINFWARKLWKRKIDQSAVLRVWERRNRPHQIALVLGTDNHGSDREFMLV